MRYRIKKLIYKPIQLNYFIRDNAGLIKEFDNIKDCNNYIEFEKYINNNDVNIDYKIYKYNIKV